MPIQATKSILTRLLIWLFSFSTRCIEVLNFMIMLGFATQMIAHYHTIVELKTYQGFDSLEKVGWWIAMQLLAVAQLIALVQTTKRSNLGSGVVLIFSSALWALIAIAFTDNDVSTTAPNTYAVIAFMCACAGLYNIKTNSKID